MHKLRFRQVHLDFHTSPAIPGVGAAFDRAQWQDALKRGHVNSVTTFALCHHGWHYHETRLGRMHPGLKFDLLRAQYEAAKEIDVNVPIYLTAGVNNRVAYEHPEWREVGADGRYAGWTRSVTEAGFHKLCFNSPYLEYLCEMIRETVALFPACDGIFLDIISQGECCCRWCLDTMAGRGLDALKESDRRECARLSLMKYYERTTQAVRDVAPAMPVFHNSGHITRGQRDILPFFSHMELESLPTGGWGYDHFPISAAYCRRLPFDFLGMTGKFHTSWGEFGGFKHPNALRYECAAMLAYGAKCSVGDQLHPSGRMDESTYDVIGAAYEEVEAKEPWCDEAEPVTEVAVLSVEALGGGHRRDNAADIGAGRILLESHVLFDLLDPQMDFSPYKVLILPDEVEVGADLEKKLTQYLKEGGRLLLTGRSGVKPGGGFVFDVGGEHEGASLYSPDFVRPADRVLPDFVQSPFVAYLRSQRLRVTTGESLGDVYDPYFNRDFRHFCSHQHTPFKPEPSGFACGVKHGSIVYLAHPVFSWYRGYGPVALKQYVVRCLNLLLGDEKVIHSNLPSTARVALADQPRHSRYVLHLLYANTISRGGRMDLPGGAASQGYTMEVIEDLVPLHDVHLSLRLPRAIRRVTLEPGGEDVEFDVGDNRLHLWLNEFTCHQMVVLHYAEHLL